MPSRIISVIRLLNTIKNHKSHTRAGDKCTSAVD